MPLVRIAMRKGKPAPYRRAITDGVHAALVEVANVPPQDRFQILTEHAPEDLIYLKEGSWREKDQIDVKAMREIIARKKQ